MKTIRSIAALEALYGPPMPAAVDKVQDCLTPLYAKWITHARFCILSTIGPEGTDASPRGDTGPVVQIADPKTLLMPDWRGNNRLDSLRNIVRDDRISLLFMIAGTNNVVRVNGRARLTAETEYTQRFDKAGKHPATVIVMEIEEVYFQCAKALMRSNLWTLQDDAQHAPSAGEFIRELNEDFDAEAYDKGYGDYAKPRMW